MIFRSILAKKKFLVSECTIHCDYNSKFIIYKYKLEFVSLIVFRYNVVAEYNNDDKIRLTIVF